MGEMADCQIEQDMLADEIEPLPLCPKCGKHVELDEELDKDDAYYICSGCGYRYPVAEQAEMLLKDEVRNLMKRKKAKVVSNELAKELDLVIKNHLSEGGKEKWR